MLKAGRFELLPGCSASTAGDADSPDAEQPAAHPAGQLQVDGAALDNLEVHDFPSRPQQKMQSHLPGILSLTLSIRQSGANNSEDNEQPATGHNVHRDCSARKQLLEVKVGCCTRVKENRSQSVQV